jgi:hypothetical protein
MLKDEHPASIEVQAPELWGHSNHLMPYVSGSVWIGLLLVDSLGLLATVETVPALWIALFITSELVGILVIEFYMAQRRTKPASEKEKIKRKPKRFRLWAAAAKERTRGASSDAPVLCRYEIYKVIECCIGVLTFGATMKLAWYFWMGKGCH